jgi:hypothetical protein
MAFLIEKSIIGCKVIYVHTFKKQFCRYNKKLVVYTSLDGVVCMLLSKEILYFALYFLD